MAAVMTVVSWLSWGGQVATIQWSLDLSTNLCEVLQSTWKMTLRTFPNNPPLFMIFVRQVSQFQVYFVRLAQCLTWFWCGWGAGVSIDCVSHSRCFRQEQGPSSIFREVSLTAQGPLSSGQGHKWWHHCLVPGPRSLPIKYQLAPGWKF